MDELKKLHKAFSEQELEDNELAKVIGNPEVGKWIEIFWKDMNDEYPGYTDFGYLFQTPYCNDDLEMFDFFVHIPEPDNSSGIGDAPAEWVHLIGLMKNPLVAKIILKK